MDIETVIRDRRKRKRSLVKENAIAVIQSVPAILLGQIKDISMDGLSFMYMHSDNQPDESATLDIFLPSDKTRVKGLTFKTVTDSTVLNDNPFSTVIMNRRSVKFVGLNDRLHAEIARVIRKIAREESETGCPLYNIKNLTRLSV